MPYQVKIPPGFERFRNLRTGVPGYLPHLPDIADGKHFRAVQPIASHAGQIIVYGCIGKNDAAARQKRVQRFGGLNQI